MRRARLNAVLLVLACALAAGVWLSRKKEQHGPPLTAMKPSQVTHVRLEHPDAPAIALQKDDGKWQLTEPVKVEADPLEVNGILALVDRETGDTIGHPDLAQLGFSPPELTLTLNDTAIAFGGVEPLNYRRYVKLGQTVTTIEDPPGTSLDKEYADLVAKELFPSGSPIERIELPKLTLSKDSAGKWQVQPPDPTAGADAMQKLADGWQRARSMWNEMAKDDAAKGDHVKVTTKDGITRDFVVSATDPQLKLTRPELHVTWVLSKALADELLKLPAPEAKKDTTAGAKPAPAAPVKK